MAEVKKKAAKAAVKTAGAKTAVKAAAKKEPAAARSFGISLVVVESPAKAKTIVKYLGPKFVVMASLGHVKDLPKKEMGVNIERDFQPKYEIIASKKKVIAELKAAAKKADAILLAADPDREGEAICQHLAEELSNGKPVQRILFNEITKQAIQDAVDRKSVV